METEHNPERLRALLSDLIQAVQFARPDPEDDFYHCPVKDCPGTWDESPGHPHAPDCILITALRALYGLESPAVSEHDHTYLNVLGWGALFGPDDLGVVVGVHLEDRTVDVQRFKTGKIERYPLDWKTWGVDPIISHFNLTVEVDAARFHAAKAVALDATPDTPTGSEAASSPLTP